MAANRGGAGKQQVIKRQLGKCCTNIHLAIEYGDVILFVSFGENFLQQRATGWRRFAHLDHHPVAGSQRANHRAEGQIERIVPRRNNADHANRLIGDHGRARPLSRADLAFLWLHPLAQVFGVVPYAFEAGHDFCQTGLVRRAGTEITVQGGADLVLILEQQGAQPVQVVDTFLCARVGVAGKGSFLRLKDFVHSLDLFVLAVQGLNIGNHGTLLKPQ